MVKVIEIDATTNTVLERDETADEKAFRDETHKAFLADNKAAETKAAERQAVLDKIGLSASEAAALLG
jgi:hypothetical protein